jgi:hypothetical protein
LTLLNAADPPKSIMAPSNYVMERAMASSPSTPMPRDLGYIDERNPKELAYWARELCCSEAELLRLIDMVGPLVVEVKRHLSPKREV